MSVKNERERESGKAKGYSAAAPRPVPVLVDGVKASLCDSCQGARWGCERFDVNLAVDRCLQYRRWTKASMQEAQRYAARGKKGSADWARLCRLIEIENRLLEDGLWP